jgi:hypothetical protein
VGEDGRYVGVPSLGWEAEIDATTVCAEADAVRLREAWEAARAGRTSPLAYHMVNAKMDATLLASEVGVWAWRVRRHLRPDVFARLGPDLLSRYADALGIDIASLRTLPDAP